MKEVTTNFMNKKYKVAAGAVAIFALVLSTIVPPVSTAIALDIDSQFTLDSEFLLDPELALDLELDVEEGSDSASSYTECLLEASSNLVTIGDSVTLSWQTSGFDTITINGELVSGDSGSKTINNLQEQTTFTLQALNEQGSSCMQQVVVGCIPPEEPDECKLELFKAVDADDAVPGDELTYTITIENTGDAACTGSGVLIEDELDDNVHYLRNTVSANLAAGYMGTPVYTNDDHTLRFNGFDLEPNESGTITWVGKVLEPNQCGDFAVTNQAKATALELDNFNSWAYSNMVQTVIDNDCYVPQPPTCTLEPAAQTVGYGAAATLTWTTTNATDVTLTGFGSVAQSGTDTTAPLYADASYVLTAIGPDGEVTCTAEVAVSEAPAPSCDLFTATPDTIVEGDSLVLTWETTNATDVVINNGIGSVDDDGSVTVSPSADTTYTLTVYGQDNQSVDCTVPVTVTTVPVPSCDLFTANPNELTEGESSTLTWETSNAVQVFMNNGVGEVALDGSVVVTPLADIVYTLTVIGQRDQVVDCLVPVTVTPPAAPSCDLFVANPSAIMVGESTTLTWETTNATAASLSGIGAVGTSGTQVVSPSVDTTYELTVTGVNNQEVTCGVPVTVSEDPLPICEVFTASPTNLPYGGGDVELYWEVFDATDVTISPTVGTVGLTGTQSVNVTESTTFTLTAVDDNQDEVSCIAPVAVADPQPDPLTCADNVSFSVSDSSITRGSSVTLNWSTTDVDAVSISQINATALSGSQTVSPSSDITYVLTATRGDESVDCPVSVDVSSGGGGGGSASPRCELDISDERISLGDSITLEWDTSRATEVTLMDDQGKILFTTDDYLASEKDDYFDGEITLKPTRDTEYTLLAERGSRDRECVVEVEVEDEIVVIQTRDQQPLVAGIALTQVPYTGFEAGPIMTLLFYALLIAWATYIAYFLVIRKRIASAGNGSVQMHMSQNERSMEIAKEIRPDAFPETTVTSAAPTQAAPANLPTGTTTVGYDSAAVVEEETNPHQATDAVVTELENHAHAQKALLSSDAVRHFIGTTHDAVQRTEALDKVIAEAKKTYPLEDGWIVVNESRMRNLCEVCQVNAAASSSEPFIPATVPEGTGSLAEAIVTGNVVAAYEMIGNRPMFALADASADLDAVYRKRQGMDATVSDLLEAETKDLSDEQIKNMIAALTGALDGTYTDEASAVKMAIMKAVKELS